MKEFDITELATIKNDLQHAHNLLVELKNKDIKRWKNCLDTKRQISYRLNAYYEQEIFTKINNIIQDIEELEQRKKY